jgi:hypothetical protein
VQAFFPSKNLITDLQYHGTHIAATVVSNGIVGAGVTSDTERMGVKVCRETDGCDARKPTLSTGASAFCMIGVLECPAFSNARRSRMPGVLFSSAIV